MRPGGWLFGTAWSWNREIALATELGPNGKRAPAWVRLDSAFRDAVCCELVDVHENHDLRFIGVWHVHPNGGDLPSETDMDAWLTGYDLHRDNDGPYLGLIVIRGSERDSYKPRFQLWATYRRSTGTPVCERAAIQDG